MYKYTETYIMSIIKLKPMAWKLLEQYLKENSYVGQPKYFILFQIKFEWPRNTHKTGRILHVVAVCLPFYFEYFITSKQIIMLRGAEKKRSQIYNFILNLQIFRKECTFAYYICI